MSKNERSQSHHSNHPNAISPGLQGKPQCAKYLSGLVERREEARLAYRKTIFEIAAILLSISAPLTRAFPPSGIARALILESLCAAAVAVLAGLVLLRQPVRQSEERARWFLRCLETHTADPFLSRQTCSETAAEWLLFGGVTLAFLSLLASAIP